MNAVDVRRGRHRRARRRMAAAVIFARGGDGDGRRRAVIGARAIAHDPRTRDAAEARFVVLAFPYRLNTIVSLLMNFDTSIELLLWRFN